MLIPHYAWEGINGMPTRTIWEYYNIIIETKTNVALSIHAVNGDLNLHPEDDYYYYNSYDQVY